MKIGENIAAGLDRAVFGDAWHGPALMQVLDGVSAEDAHRRPIEAAHSIHELAAHAATWLEVIRQRLEHRPPNVTDDMDWEPDLTTDRWQATRERVAAAARTLATTIRALDDAKLDERVPGDNSKWSVYETAQGAIEHTLYHTGQIAIVKKGLSA
jgi:uncharacterized damage-inducible protein DinB